jgi:cytoskeletal protein CcmA (bactofilin family)
MGILGSAHSGANREAGLSILSAGARLVGDLRADGDIRIEGEVEGNVYVHGQVLVAPGGVVRGDILTREAIVGGEVKGQVMADELVRLHAGSVVVGNLVSPRVAVEEGGELNGTIRTAKPEALKSAPRSAEHRPRLGLSEPDEAPREERKFRTAG